MTIRNCKELSRLKTFEERFRYLKLDGKVGEDTFGFDRYVNQIFYKSRDWRAIRDVVIIRDGGCDLGIDGRDIFGKIYIHHVNPITFRDLELRSSFLLDPEYLISVTFETHNAIHYGDEKLLNNSPVERTKNDTCPWRTL